MNQRLAQRTGCLDCCFLFPAWGRVGVVTGGISEPVLCIGAAQSCRSGMGSYVLQCPRAGSCNPLASLREARLNGLLAVCVQLCACLALCLLQMCRQSHSMCGHSLILSEVVPSEYSSSL